MWQWVLVSLRACKSQVQTKAPFDHMNKQPNERSDADICRSVAAQFLDHDDVVLPQPRSEILVLDPA